MMAAQLLIVIVACLAGQITCAELDPLLKRCDDKVFDDPGYSLGCTYTCKNGNRSDRHRILGRLITMLPCAFRRRSGTSVRYPYVRTYVSYLLVVRYGTLRYVKTGTV
uniref:Putative 18 2 19 kDa secreted protein n=1 Tax=Ixodes ricinus TaxID=34613 RepID=V5HE84_IXORI